MDTEQRIKINYVVLTHTKHWLEKKRNTMDPNPSI